MGEGGAALRGGGVGLGGGYRCRILSPSETQAAQHRTARFPTSKRAGGEPRSPNVGGRAFPGEGASADCLAPIGSSSQQVGPAAPIGAGQFWLGL